MVNANSLVAVVHRSWYDNAQPIQSLHDWKLYDGFQNMIRLNPIMLRVILHLMIVIVMSDNRCSNFTRPIFVGNTQPVFL